MANGDIITNIRNCFEVNLLDAQSATSNGAWVEVPAHLNQWAVYSSSLEEGATDAVIDIHVMNAPTKPSDATAGSVWKQLVLATTNYSAQGGFRYVKGVKTAGTTPVATTVTLRCTPQR
jgi:hypothetical protein